MNKIHAYVASEAGAPFKNFMGAHHLCANVEGTIVGRHGGFADKVRAHWSWVLPLPEGIVLQKAGPLFCGGITVFNPIILAGVSPLIQLA